MTKLERKAALAVAAATAGVIVSGVSLIRKHARYLTQKAAATFDPQDEDEELTREALAAGENQTEEAGADQTEEAAADQTEEAAADQTEETAADQTEEMAADETEEMAAKEEEAE